MIMKQTAVEWLVEQFNTTDFIYKDRNEIIEQAKEKEKKQLKKAIVFGLWDTSGIEDDDFLAEQYFQETFKK